MSNMLTSKCWRVEVMGYHNSEICGRSGWRTEQVLELSGLEVVGLLAFNEKGGECMLRIVPMEGNKSTVSYMLERAVEAAHKARRIYERHYE